MTKKLATAIIFVILFGSAARSAHSFEQPGRFFPLPPALQSSVQRSIASKPGDLFSVLRNGMTVLIRRSPGSDVVSAQVFVRAGSLYEGKYLTAGLSHYLEHVVSGGSTRSFTEDEAKQRLQNMGGETNAYTSFDRTVYYINTSGDHWKDAVDLLLSYVTESTLDPQQVAREKAVIQQEYKLGENDPDRELWKLFMKTAYQVHPVRNPVIGYEEVFVQQDHNALLDYYSSRYQPENMTIAVVGNIDPLQVLQFIADKTGNFNRTSSEPVVWPAEPSQLSSRWEKMTLPIARLTQVMLGFPSVTLQNQDLYALDVLAFLLGGGKTSRLYHRLKEAEDQVLSVSATNWTPSFVTGQFIVSLDLPPQNWPGVLTAIQEEVDRFKKDLVAAEELEKAKKNAIAQHVFQKETVSAMASSLASSYFDTGDAYFDEAYVDGIRQVSAQQIRDVAQRYLDMGRVNAAVVQPQATQAGSAAAEATALKPVPVNRERLENGLEVLLKRDGSLPMVSIQLYGLGGLALEERQHPGISSFTASLLTAGTKARSKLEIARAIEEVGGSMEGRSENNTYHVAIKVLKEDLDLALDVLADVVKNAQYPQDEIEKKRKETLLAIQRLDENWQAEIVRFFKANYFQNSSYGNERLGTVDSVKSFNREEILKFYQKMVTPGSSALTVYGDIDSKAVLASIRKKFGDWNGQPTVEPEWPDATKLLVSDRSVEKKNEKTSAALIIGTNGLSIDSADRPILDVVNAVLSGAGGPMGRLFDALRGGNEDLVYLVGSFPFYGKNAGYFAVITQTTLANLDKVQKVILDNLKRLRDEPVSGEELARVKSMLLTTHRMDLESLSAQGQSAAVNEVLGLGWDYDERYAELIKAVTAEQVQQLSQKLFAHTLIVRTIPENPVEILAPPSRPAPEHMHPY